MKNEEILAKLADDCRAAMERFLADPATRYAPNGITNACQRYDSMREAIKLIESVEAES